jgi:hypothetical protein
VLNVVCTDVQRYLNSVSRTSAISCAYYWVGSVAFLQSSDGREKDIDMWLLKTPRHDLVHEQKLFFNMDTRLCAHFMLVLFAFFNTLLISFCLFSTSFLRPPLN